MPNRVLEYVQRGLIAALAVVLALVVWLAFRGVLESPADTGLASPQAGQASTTSSAATTTAPEPGDPAVPVTPAPTTTIARLFQPPWGEGTCDDPEPSVADDQTLLRIYYTCGEPEAPTGLTFVYRRVPATNQVLTNTFRQLVRGPNANEQARGYGTFFDGNVTIESVSLREGRAIIDFVGLPAIADVFTTQEAVQFFLANLGANAFQFSSVQAVEYRSDGDCSDFWEILGRSTCEVISRTQWLAGVEPNR